MISGGKTRLVFRIKTNRGFDDEDNGANGFSSGTAGAAIIDDVVVSGTGVTGFTVGFESAGDIDNNSATAFHSTGKPVGNWAHVENIQVSGLPFDDPCGSVDAAVRFCNMYGNVIVLGNKDNADKPGGDFGSNTQDQQKEIASSTINLKNDGIDGHYNAMGIDHEIASNVIQVASRLPGECLPVSDHRQRSPVSLPVLSIHAAERCADLGPADGDRVLQLLHEPWLLLGYR